MQKKTWSNKTQKHPKGVCEGATSIWLQRISNKSLADANQITANDCDTLQEQIEKGSYTWATDLLPTLKKDATFDAFDGPNITKEQDIKDVLQGLKNGQFVYVSAANPTGNGHALAFYKQDTSTICFFDPNNAIYTGTVNELAGEFMTNIKSWTDVAARIGSM